MIGTGGSIATLARDRCDLVEYSDVNPLVDIETLLGGVPEVNDIADVRTFDFGRVKSSALSADDWAKLSHRVDEVSRAVPGIAGVVISHGTATLEETGYFLSLTLRTAGPVVLTGAQRPVDAIGADGPLSLLNAFRVAASPHARHLGVVTVFNGEIHAARDVVKTDTYALDAFRSPDLGPLGFVEVDGSVQLYRRQLRAPTGLAFDIGPGRSFARVEIVYSYAGADGAAIDSAADRGSRGVVVTGLVPGAVTPEEWSAIIRARAEGVVVVLSHRGHRGRVLTRTMLREQGVVVAGNLTPQKARILCLLALTLTQDPERIQALYDSI